MPDVTTVEHRAQTAQVRQWLATIRDSEDLISVGAYVSGSNPEVDTALGQRAAITDFARQRADTLSGFESNLEALRALTAGAEQ